MNKKYLLIYVILICIVFFASGCYKEKVIKIGVVGTMTGNQSDLSVSGRRGIEIAVNQINEAGGINNKRVELVVKNDMNDPVRSKEIVEEFVEENIEIVIGPFTSGMILAAYENVSHNEILYIGPTISADSLNQIDDNIIRFIASTKEQAEIINKVAAKDHLKDFIVIYDKKNIGFNESLFNNFKNLLKKSEGTIVDEYGYDQVNNDSIEDVISMLASQNENVDAVFIISNAIDLATIVKEIRKKDMMIEVYGPLWAHTNDLIRIGGVFVEQVNVVSGIDVDTDKEKFKDFNDVFEMKYGKQISFASIYSYESMMAIKQAIELSNSSNYLDVKKAIIQIREFEGLQEDFVIDENGDTTRSYMMDKIIENMYIRID